MSSAPESNYPPSDKPQSRESYRVADDNIYRPSERLSSESVSEVDQLNRSRLVNALTTLLTSEDDHHQTIGLLGDWGVGKSTTINLLKKSLKQKHAKQPYLFAHFNAWEYVHTDNIQAGIAQEMINGLTSFQASSWASSAPPARLGVGDWLKKEVYPWCWWLAVRLPMLFRFAVALSGPRILALLVAILLSCIFMSWQDITNTARYAMTAELGAQMFMGGGVVVFAIMLFRQIRQVLAAPLAKELFTYIKLPDYGEHLGQIPVMRETIRKLCEVRLNPHFAAKKRLLFVVDDLDRCDPKGIVKVFEAVRLVLDIPQVVVIIAVDHRIALAALSMQYKALSEHHQLSNSRAIARDYLAKVIHQPITLTPADADSVSGYLDYIWRETESDGLVVEPEQSDVVPVEPAPKNQAGEDVRYGLSDSQKQLFKTWAAHFAFTNPRQLKRLHNSYNLLRLYFDDAHGQQVPQINLDFSSPFLISLFALEYINSLEDPEPRNALLARLKQKQALAFQEEAAPFDMVLGADAKITEEVLSVMLSKHNGSGLRYVEAVAPFVLPALLVAENTEEPQDNDEPNNN